MLTPGSLIRTLLLALILPYIWNELLGNRLLKIVLAASVATIALTAVLSAVTKSPFFLQQEAVFYMKALYFVVSGLFIMLYVQKPLLARPLTRRALLQVSYLVGGSYVLALLTKTSFPSYPYGEIGYSGWFFSANELSVITIVLVASVLAIIREQRTVAAYGALVPLALMGMLIGTKSAYIGVALLLVVHIVELAITYHKRAHKHVWASVLLCLLYFGAFPLVPMTENSSQNHTEQATTVQIEQLQQTHFPGTNVLSSRQDYARAVATDFQHAPLLRNLFGLGYAGDYETEPKMIEMDFLELFFSFGVVGSIILLTPLIVLGGWLFKSGSLRHTSPVLLTGFALTAGVAALAGHVLFAPSVMSYVIASAALFSKKSRMENERVVKMVATDTCTPK